ncbi:MAG TPA: chromosomal replication initiator protein DnaA, partial [Acidimicrobiia bacterium]|nr:chromosomal replication initiator protein DnaA [Acidimicrobiia bacterium]
PVTSIHPTTSTSAEGPSIGRLTFEDFVIGSSNRFAHAAAQAVAETPGRSYNPLFIYGDAGLGKTHLLQAVGNYVTAHYPTYRVQYVSSETFMSRFVEAIRNKQLQEFKDRYRKNDVLLVDDIQFMEGKEGLQEEFFHTFNSIQQEGGQIVMSSDRSPDSISTLEDRLRSRFKMGLVTHIQPPDVETRLAILRKKAEQTPSGIQVPDDVLLFIAESITNNIRELEGALTRVTAYSSLNHEPCTRALAVSILSDLISSTSPLIITPELILSKTTDLYGFSREELIGPNRRRPLVTARQVSMYVFRELTDLSYPSLGRLFGGRDHTTVIHAVDKIGKLMPERRDIYDQVSALISSIRTRP